MKGFNTRWSTFFFPSFSDFNHHNEVGKSVSTEPKWDLGQISLIL